MTTSLDLAARARELIDSCLIIFGEGWNSDAAISLHQQVEALAEEADAAGSASLAEQLFELSVFLCGVVDQNVSPSAVLQTRIATMCEAVAPVEVRGIVQSEAELGRANETSRHPLVLLLVDPGTADPALAKAVTQLNFLAFQVDSLTALAVEVSRRSVAVVAMSKTWVDSAADVIAAIEHAHPHALTQPGTLALIEQGQRAKRMFALRAGVDQVVETTSADALADSIAEFIAKRLNSAFRVLIVEDDRGQALFAQKVLGHRGMLTQVATSAAEALAMVDQFSPDLCLLDLNLPDRNGIELAQLLRDKPGFEFVQIVFLTGELNPDARTLAVRLGADDWIVKPVRPRDLLAVVETRAARARRSLWLDSSSKLGREAARGVQSRRRMLSAISDLENTEAEGAQSVLVAVAPNLDSGSVEVCWLDQAELGGEVALVLRAHGLVRSEVCQAETLVSLFIAEPAAGNQQTLASIASDLERRHWLSSSEGLQLPFALVGVQLDGTLTADGAVDAALGLLRKAQLQAPRVRFQASSVTSAQPTGWPELRDMFANDALGRSQTLAFVPIVPVDGSRGGKYWLRESFEVRIAVGEACVPDHRAFARSSGFHLRLDQWVLARCFDRIRMARGDLALVAEICPETIEDPTFAIWVQAECQRRRIESPNLTLMVNADRMRNASSRTESALRPLVEQGLKIALGPLSDSANDQRLARLGAVSIIVCQVAAEGVPLPLELLKLAAELQKQVLVMGVDDASSAEVVFRQPVHFACGDAISPPLSRPEFEFPT